jgi:uncharacterized protein
VAPKPELVRFAVLRAGAAASAVPDRRGAMPGRGAYVCKGGEPGVPSTDCLELARNRGGMSRALRCSVKIDTDFVELVER